MPIIDICCGIGPWRTRDPLLPYAPAQTLALLDHFGIDKALVYSSLAAQGGTVADGQAIIQEAVQLSPRFLPTLTLDFCPHRPEAREAVLTTAAKAVCCYAPPDVLIYGDIAERCEQRRLPWLLSLGWWTPAHIHQLCAAFPRLRVILSGLDYRADEWLYPLLAQHDELRICPVPNYICPRGLERFVARFGAARLLFGSGLPEFSPGGLISYIMYSELSAEEKAGILAGNAEALFQEVGA